VFFVNLKLDHRGNNLSGRAIEPNLPASQYAEALNVMGLVAHDRRQWAEALDCFEQALQHYRSLHDRYQVTRVLNNRGPVLLRSGSPGGGRTKLPGSHPSVWYRWQSG
jgi:tetratricopeptide (TPR) repeat protein